jgi:hypothetical protein
MGVEAVRAQLFMSTRGARWQFSGRHEKVRLTEVSRTASNVSSRCPQKDSNLRTWLRRPVLYPLSYGGSLTEKGYQSTAVGVTRVP